MLKANSTIKRSEGIVQAEIDGETVMMSIENGAYYGLDVVASRIWELVETPKSVEALCEQLQEEYEVEESQCQEDVFKFLNDMIEHNVIQLDG